tara:strand:+ start:1959 stop:2846 length:888 start_codon:yes stop_codon:yes gene_type:complete
MKIFDCTTFYNENMMMDVRFNILDPFVDKFVISEAKYSHSGEKKKLNFDINKFNSFKNKIIYLVVENEPKNLSLEKNTKKRNYIRENAIKRIEYQRDFLINGLGEAEDNDYIFYSDNDEIPNFENTDVKNNKNKILAFKQKMFYYKFNLFCDRIDWFGTRGCKKKYLKSFSWLRNIKIKQYPFYRLDTYLSNTKYIDLRIVTNGGWHFSQVKTPEDIFSKLTNSEDHYEYKQTKKGIEDIEDIVRRKVIIYDHQAKTSKDKFNKEFKLTTIPLSEMPIFLQKNSNKYSSWIDIKE